MFVRVVLRLGLFGWIVWYFRLWWFALCFAVLAIASSCVVCLLGFGCGCG